MSKEITFDGRKVPEFVLSLFNIEIIFADKLMSTSPGYCGTAIQTSLANLKIEDNILTLLDSGEQYSLTFAADIRKSMKVIQDLNIQHNYEELNHIINNQILNNPRYQALTEYNSFDVLIEERLDIFQKKLDIIEESLKFLNCLKIIKEEEFGNFYKHAKYIQSNDERLMLYEKHVWDRLLPGLIVSHTQSFYIYEDNLVSFITYKDDDNIFKGLIYILEGEF